MALEQRLEERHHIGLCAGRLQLRSSETKHVIARQLELAVTETASLGVAVLDEGGYEVRPPVARDA